MVTKTAYASLPQAFIAIQGFEGPIELLLHLLDEGKLEVTSVSLAAVTDQYLDAVRVIPACSERLDFLAEFLVLGAQLLLMKSRSLLPREAARELIEEVLDEATIEMRLREYRRFRQAATQLHERQAAGARSFSRLGPPPLPALAPPPDLERAVPEQLAAALTRLLASRIPEPQQPEALPRVTIGERIRQIDSLHGYP